MGHVTGLVRLNAKFLINCGKGEYRTINALLTRCLCTPRSTKPNISFSSIFFPTILDNSVRPNVNASSDPQVLPTKLAINPPLNPNAIPAAVSTTDVGNPQHSQNMKPNAYRNNPWCPFEAMSLSVCIIAVRNLSRLKKVWRVSQCKNERVVIMAMMDVMVMDFVVIAAFLLSDDDGDDDTSSS